MVCFDKKEILQEAAKDTHDSELHSQKMLCKRCNPPAAVSPSTPAWVVDKGSDAPSTKRYKPSKVILPAVPVCVLPDLSVAAGL